MVLKNPKSRIRVMIFALMSVVNCSHLRFKRILLTSHRCRSLKDASHRQEPPLTRASSSIVSVDMIWVLFWNLSTRVQLIWRVKSANRNNKCLNSRKKDNKRNHNSSYCREMHSQIVWRSHLVRTSLSRITRSAL